MKIRNGYVSNSSSSSYIIAYNTNAVLMIPGIKECFTINDFFEAIEHCHKNWTSEDTDMKAVNEEELLSRYENYECFCEYDKEENDKFITILKQFIHDNKKDSVGFCEISISYHDAFIKKLYTMFKESGSVVELSKVEN